MALQWGELASLIVVGLKARTGIQDFLNMKQEYRLANRLSRAVEIINNLKIRFLKISVKAFQKMEALSFSTLT